MNFDNFLDLLSEACLNGNKNQVVNILCQFDQIHVARIVLLLPERVSRKSILGKYGYVSAITFATEMHEMLEKLGPPWPLEYYNQMDTWFDLKS